jgi:putative tricarboxylic transport membrane protein
MDHSKDRIGYLFCAAVGAAAFWLAGDFQQESAIFPRVISAAMVVIGSGLTLLNYVQYSPQIRSLPQSDAATGEQPAGWFIHNTRFAQAVSLTLIYFLAVPRLGYYTATALVIPIGAVMLGLRRRPILIISTTFTYLLLVYLTFGVFFQRPLPREAILQLLP